MLTKELPSNAGRKIPNFYRVESPTSAGSWWSVIFSKRRDANERLKRELQTLHTYTGTDVVPMKLCSGKVSTDYLNGPWFPVVSRRFLDVLLNFDQGKGRQIPVAIYDSSDTRVISEEYVWYVPWVGAGRIDPNRGYCLLTTFPRSAIIGKHPFGFVWDESTWDGSEVFCFEGGQTLIVSERVAQAIESKGVDRLILEDTRRVGLNMYREICRRAGLSQPPELEGDET